ncbi:MAG: hypothetical protein SCARUB_00297 [Candidatus Scalindua rubra]|uniref:Glycosyltransferase RgtA/B/C/D-like domain-containing protein n=1 Tax=Candidatus Scalindua rubra TaxID=1872076 RepID=A0A1E3XG21_9BACT|nr:MAG: hypothetical protein SCARUB_00297 [Candidatus Scalindua rubra]
MIDILLLIIFMILAISIGAYFFDFYKLEFSSRMEFLLFSLAIGLGIISYTIFFLAVMGILYSWTIYIFLILLLLFSIPKIYRSTRQFRYKSLKVTHQPFINYLLFFIIGTYIGLTFIDALVPPTEADSLVYHLADPKKFLKYHSLIHTQIPGIDLKTSKIMPFNFEMLYVIPLTFDRDIFAKLIQFGTALCAGLVLYMLSARFFSKLAGLFAVAVFLIQPFVFNYVSTPKVDTAIVLYAILSLYTFLVWYDNQESKWLILCGIFSGLFFACKLSGLFLMIILSVLIFYKLFYEKKFDFKYSGFYLIKYLVPAFIITAPWLLRSWVVIGDPLYPYIIKLTGDHFKTNLIHHKKSVIDFITYPWNLTLDPGQLMRRGSIYKEKNISFVSCHYSRVTFTKNV